MEYTLERYEKNFNKYIVKFSDGSEKYMFFKSGKKELKKNIETYGIDDVIKQHEIERLEGRKTKVKAIGNSAFNKQIEELKQQKTDIVLQLMNFNMVKGSPEHTELRRQLHVVQDELLLIPGYETWDQAMSHYTREELSDLRRLGEQKKAEKKEKKFSKIKGQK